MKKNRQKLYKSNVKSEMEYSKIIKIAVGVLVFLLIIYLVTAIATGEIKFGKKSKSPKVTTIQYQEIIAGETFNRNYKEYYVLFYDFTSVYADYFKSAISSYESKSNSLPVFIVDLTQEINKQYVINNDSNSTVQYAYPSDINSLNVENPTLLKIKNKKTIEVVKGNDNIIDALSK